LADLFLPAHHQFLDFFLQLCVQPVILLSQVVRLLLLSTLAMLLQQANTISYAAPSRNQDKHMSVVLNAHNCAVQYSTEQF